MTAGAVAQKLIKQVDWSITNIIRFIKKNRKMVKSNALGCANWIVMQSRKEMCPVDWDLAWLPDWLQFNLNQIEWTDDDQSSKEMAVFRYRESEGNDVDLSDRDGVGYNNCRLHWSGESNSPTNVAQTTGNVLHFNLKFSSDSDLECIKSQVPTASQAKIQSVKCSPSPRSETTDEPVEIDRKSRGEEKQNYRYFEEVEVDDAVEFSIAASEAVLINELVESEPALEYLAMPTVVEIALRVKQARLEGLLDTIDDRTEHTSEDCSPLETDNFMMMDAFKDVGLSSTDYDDSDSIDFDVSVVRETPVIADHEGHLTVSEADENRDDRVGTSAVHPPNQLDEVFDGHSQLNEHLPLEPMVNDTDVQDDVPGNVTPNPSISSLPTCADKLPHQSPEKNSCSSTQEKRVGLMELAETTNLPHSDLNFTSHQLDGQNYAATKRFKSRWLGGWSKEVENATVKPKEHRSFANLFRGETSFLSESADIAPDENSVVQEHETKRTEMASQSNVPSNSSCDKPSDGELFSEEVIRSSSLSLVDPLCSIVPCSISVEDPQSLHVRRQDAEDVGAGKSSSPALCFGLTNLCEPSDQEMNINLQTNLSINGDDSQAIVRRQLSSLKNYSSFLPEGLAHFGSKVDSYSLAKLNRRIKASHADRNSTRSRSTSSGLTSAISIAKCAVRKNGKKHGSSNFKQNNKEMSLLLQSPAKRRLPLIFGPRKKCRIQVPKFPAQNSTENDKGFVLQANAVKVQSILQNKHLECQKTIESQVPGKKKVRFAEASTILQKDMPIRNLKSSRKNGGAAGSNKKSGYPSLELDSRTQHGQNLSRCTNSRNRLIFQGVEFLITGFSKNKEKEIEGLIQRHGGVVLLDIPSIKSRGKRSAESPLWQQPVVISPKKLKTAKFLYGCAVRTIILKFIWLTDSISAGSTIPPEKYMVIPNQAALVNYATEEPISLNQIKRIFEQVGIMLLGKCSFYAKFTSIINHGGGQAFKTLQQLFRSLDNKKVSVGIIVTEYESKPSRHLRQCAMERNIPIMPISWIIESLYVGKLQPLPS